MTDIPNRIEELKKRLYQREEPHFTQSRGRLSPIHTEAETGWRSEDQMPKNEIIGFSFLKRLLVASIIFFIGVVGFSAYVFFGGSNVVSPDKIDIVVNGPVSVKGGDPLALDMVLNNKNNVALEDVQLTVKYPAGTRSVDDFSQENQRYQKFIGELKSSAPYTETVKAVLFGAEQSTQVITVELEYRVPGSHAIFTKTKDFPILLTSAPVSITTHFPKEVNSDQEITFSVDIISNSPNVLRDILLNVSYPSGFTFKSATPVPTYGNNIWDLGDLPVSAKRTINISGVIEGQNQDLKAFRVNTGIKKPGSEREIGVVYSSTFETMTVARPFVAVDMSINNSEQPTISAAPNQRLKTEVNITNNLPDPVRDAEIGIKLSGSFSRASVNPIRGFYRSADDTVVWTKLEQPTLASLEPGETLGYSFTFNSQNVQQIRAAQVSNPTIGLDLLFRGKRIVSGSQGVQFETKISRLVRINTTANFTAKLLHFTGAFSNTGPIPPRADKETTYTILLSTASVLNNLSDAHVSLTLPAYIKWLGVVSPSDEDVRFNKDTNQVTWNVGQIKTDDAPHELSVQVSFQPSLTQVDTVPTVASNIIFTATDSFTNSPISVSTDSVTTRFSSEPGYIETMSRVEK